MRVLSVSASDAGGGAARAARRVHAALGSIPKVESAMLIGNGGTSSSTSIGLERNHLFRILMAASRRVLDQEVVLSPTPNDVFRSPARLRTSAIRRIREIDPDVVLLHWLGSRMMSIRQIGQISRPTAWILHDSWTFCGAEHHPYGEADRRFIDGYRRENRLDGERGLDLNRRVWERKRKHWVHPIQLIAPSRWMAEQASRSALAAGWPVVVIPNPIDVAWWSNQTRRDSRRKLGLDPEAPLLLYGALGGDRNSLKGADLLYDALKMVPTHHGLRPDKTLEVRTFGGKLGVRQVGPHRVRSVGPLDDDGLRSYYSAADVMVVPSRMDNLPQTAVEAIVCGTPVVAFRTGGLPDIVDDGINGRLAEPFSPESLSRAIGWVLGSSERHHRLSSAARSTAWRWNPELIAKRYVALFEEMLER